MRDATPPHAAHHRDHKGTAAVARLSFAPEISIPRQETPEQVARAVHSAVAAQKFLADFYKRLKAANGNKPKPKGKR